MKFIIPEKHGKRKDLQQQEKEEIQVPPDEKENVTHQLKIQGTRHKVQGRRRVILLPCTLFLVPLYSSHYKWIPVVIF